MPALPLPNWFRVLGWGLAASLVLHWVVLDLIRGAASLPGAPTRSMFRINLQASPIEAAATPIAPADAQPLPVQTVPIRPEVKTQASYSSSPAMADALARPSSSASAIQIEGLRSGKPDEAMVAMRLAIVRALGTQSKLLPASSGSVLLWCDFDANGHLVAVRSESGAASVDLQAAVRRAVAGVAIPESLAGQAFSLDLLVETED